MFITFEGIEGSGKSSLMERLAARLEESGHAVRLTREPGGSRLGRQLRGILLDIENTDLTSQAELFLYLADRAQHVAQVIRPALAAGQVVLCDRYADSTVVYQGYGRGLDVDRLQASNDMAVDGLWPDLSLLLDLPVKTGLSRALGRNDELGQSKKEGRFEAESLEFHSRVRQGYLDWAARNGHRFRTVDASQDQDRVFADAWALVKPLLDRP